MVIGIILMQAEQCFVRNGEIRAERDIIMMRQVI